MDARADDTEAPGTERPTDGLLDSEERAVFDASPDGCLIVDRGGVIRDLNAEAERLFGYDRDELLGRGVELLVPEALRDRHEAQRRAYARRPVTRPMGVGLELSGRRRDGSDFPVDIALSPLHREGDTYVIAAVRDVSDRRRLREFGAGVLRGAEEERERLARELHDDTAQTLSALLLRLQLARRAQDPERREEALREMHGELHRASQSVYRILRGLRPPALEATGVVAAIQGHLRHAIPEGGPEVELEAEAVDSLLDTEAKLALYRIVQEAVANAVRHADAGTIRIHISDGGGAVVATVEDDGCGFDPQGRDEGAGLGLLGMEERARLVGGRISLWSAPGEGTRVHLEVPVQSGG